MAQDALELLDHVGWHDRVHLVGISMGGMISLEMVDADPFRFISLTLTSTTARRNIPTVSLNTLETFETQQSLVGCRLCLIKNCIYLS
jgi:pimeloyl-ACP methyl ester carboxylesterase